MKGMFRDLIYGWRMLKGKPGLTVISILALALGIGANTALFSILYAVLWKPLPYLDPDRLAIVWESREANQTNVVSPANFLDWKEQNSVFSDMAAFVGGAANLNSAGDPEEIPIQYASSNLFSVLGARPFLGRIFQASDDKTEERMVILSYGLWVRRFGSDRGVVGKKITLSGRQVTIVGVMPQNFYWYLKQGAVLTSGPPELWSLFRFDAEDRIRRGRYLDVVARLKPGVSLAQARSAMDVISKRLESQYADFNKGWSILTIGLREQLSGDLKKPLWILAGAVAFVLLIACTDVANLMLVRAVSRRREIAVRVALGAGRSQIFHQLLTESILLSILGGVAGIFLAIIGIESITVLGSRAGIDFGRVEMNWIVLLFTLGVSVGTGILFGLVPGFVFFKSNLPENLKEGSRGTVGEGGKIRGALVIAEVAVALLLLTGAGLLMRSYWKLTSLDLGFKADQVLTFRTMLTATKYPEDRQRIEWFRNLVDQIQNQPGVKSAGMISFLPFAGLSAGTSFEIVGHPKSLPGESPITNVFVVDQGFFKTLQVPLKRGRFFDRIELIESKKVVIINEALARTYFPNEDPIGKKLLIDMMDNPQPTEIIGIVGDLKQMKYDEQVRAAVYWPHPELAYSFMSIVVRGEGDVLSLVPSMRKIVHQMDPSQPLAKIRTLEDWLDDSTARSQFSTLVLLLFSSAALILALAGVYGVMSHTVMQRTQEFGVRMAMGAGSIEILKLVLKQGTALILTGVAAGAFLALVLTRLMSSMLFATSATDPIIFTSSVLLLILTALFASFIPSYRAARVDPLEALRYE